MQFLYNTLTSDQPLNFPSDCSTVIRFSDKSSNGFVAAGINPVILRLRIWICQKCYAIIHNIPRTVNFHISKLVSIIPFLYLLIFIWQVIIFQKFSHFLVCKSKVFIKPYIGNGQNFKIIQSCKNTFFWYPHTTGQYRQFQTFICFKHLFKQLADQHCHFFVISMLRCLWQWNIIFIDQKNRLFSMMFFK